MSRRCTTTLPLAWVTLPMWLTTSSAVSVTGGGVGSAAEAGFAGWGGGVSRTRGSCCAPAPAANAHNAAAAASGASTDGGRGRRRDEGERNTRTGGKAGGGGRLVPKRQAGPTRGGQPVDASPTPCGDPSRLRRRGIIRMSIIHDSAAALCRTGRAALPGCHELGPCRAAPSLCAGYFPR